jgi:selenide, water dikinase
VVNVFDAHQYPDLLVGLGHPDDAAVWKLDEARGLVVTTDFFTPVVDDPYDFGSIAAANSISDIYAMGGSPFLALNIAAFLTDLPPELNAAILQGGAEKCREAGIVIAGGHTIKDSEPKYGLVVLGFVRPDQMLTKGGAQPGDALVLTKPLGFGVTTTALKEQKASTDDVKEVVSWMKTLNKRASELAIEMKLHGGTDITGYGLLGHGSEMAEASRVGLRILVDKLPFVSCAEKYAGMGTFPGGAMDNKTYFGPRVRFASSISEQQRMLLFDPQTSGGLLLAVPDVLKESFRKRAEEIHQPIWFIGEVTQGSGIEVV